ncbi:MAG: nitronate monooxygenase [Gammaproteobacteria bacterium]|jgi:nitronate monooxygenase
MASASLRTALCDLLGCRLPILSAGMGGVARAELAAAVCEAGGFGSLGMVREPPELIRREIGNLRERSDRDFGVNLIPSATDPVLFDEQMAACRDERVPAMTFFWEVDGRAVSEAHAFGSKVLYQVGSVADALAAQAAGADAVIAQGMEAGGHVRGRVSSLVLLPLVCAAVRVPVVASGGFGSGAALAAALALGAAGVHCGTVFLATPESNAHELHKQRILDSSAEQTVLTDAFSINWPPGSPVRVLESPVTEKLGDKLFGHHPERLQREVVADDEGRDIYLFSTDSPLRSTRGELERMALFAGQVAGQVRRIEYAGDIVARMARDARRIIAGLADGNRD